MNNNSFPGVKLPQNFNSFVSSASVHNYYFKNFEFKLISYSSLKNRAFEKSIKHICPLFQTKFYGFILLWITPIKPSYEHNFIKFNHIFKIYSSSYQFITCFSRGSPR